MKKIYIGLIAILLSVLVSAQSQRLSIVIADFSINGASPALAKMINEYVINYFTETGKYKVIERAQLNKVLRELRLSNSDLADAGNAIKIGKLLSAYGIVIGSLTKLKNELIIIVRLVSTQTALIVRTSKVKVSANAGEEVLDNTCKAIVNKLARLQGENPFKDNGNGTITDKRTNLIWQKQPGPKSMEWKDAKKYAEKLRLAGNRNWRLPTIDEFKALLKGHLFENVFNDNVDAPYKMLEKSGFKNIGRKFFWSSTNNQRDDDFAWIVQMGEGGINVADKDLNYNHYALCVRN